MTSLLYIRHLEILGNYIMYQILGLEEEVNTFFRLVND